MFSEWVVLADYYRVMLSIEQTPVAADVVGLLEGLCTTRAIRRYKNEPIPEVVLRDIMFAATRAPSGSNRQPFRFIVLTDSDVAAKAKQLIASGAQKVWNNKRTTDGYDSGSGVADNSAKARMARTMQQYVDHLEDVPVLVLACLVRYREPNALEGASVYPACQNVLLAARALGYGGVLTGFHSFVEPGLRALLQIPEGTAIAASITLGKPEGRHGPVRRAPMSSLIFGDRWEVAPSWAQDPPDTATIARRF